MKKTPPAPPAPAPATKPERWRIDAGDADVATLVIPADSLRLRRFEIDCRFVVMRLSDGATHGMRVDVDGDLEWTRQAPTENPGHTDSMDYHFRRELAVGQALRIVVKTQAKQARRVALTIEADEA
ncbi:MAG: hypothetical protein JF586_01665 [Burkholderiales bacterium]|jgi:hypothetical protein|nr:hypothetical protein [Burkholderiales bacterium]